MNHASHSPPIPLLDIEAENAPLHAELRAACDRVVTSGRFILGPEVDAFETEARNALGVGHAIGVSSGTDALLVSLTALGISPGDEVITTAFSFIATAEAIARVHAKPIFVDIEPHTLNISGARVAHAMTQKTRAILPVHLFGRPCAMESLSSIATSAGVPLIEDAAQAFGARTSMGPVGSIGELGCFSFFPSKNLGGFGDGGLVTCASREVAEKIRRLRLHGAEAKYVFADVGGNFRLDALQAALLRVKLPKVREWTQQRRNNAALYTKLFAQAGLPQALLTTPEPDPDHVWNQYVIRSIRRDALRTRLADRGVATEIYYPTPLHAQPCFRALGYRPGSFPEAEAAAREVLALPIFPSLGATRIERIVGHVIDALA